MTESSLTTYSENGKLLGKLDTLRFEEFILDEYLSMSVQFWVLDVELFDKEFLQIMHGSDVIATIQPSSKDL